MDADRLLEDLCIHCGKTKNLQHNVKTQICCFGKMKIKNSSSFSIKNIAVRVSST